jgi:hypothetical protein
MVRAAVSWWSVVVMTVTVVARGNRDNGLHPRQVSGRRITTRRSNRERDREDDDCRGDTRNVDLRTV